MPQSEVTRVSVARTSEYHGSLVAVSSLASVLLVAMVVSACALSSAGPNPDGPGPTARTATPAPASPEPPAPPPLSVTYCIDGSSSYPAQLREQAKNDFISQLDHLVVPGFPGAKVNELWILLHSRAPWAKIDAFTIPGIRPAPVREPDPAQPAPPDRNDPAFVFDREAKKQAEEEYQQALSGWQKKAADNERMYQDAQAETLRDLAAAHTAVAQAAQILIAAPPPAGDDGSDFGGCFEKAAVVLGRAAGPRFLIIASDMSAWGEQDLGSLPLAGVRIRVIDFFCLRVSECDAARANWEPVFHAAGAASTDYFDPDEDLSTIFN